MKWLKRNKFVILLLIFIVVIIVGYFTNLYSLIGINDWKDAASVVTIAGIIVGIFYYISAIKWNSYRYLADLYYKILEKCFENPDFCDSEKTRNYKTKWQSDPEKYQYDVFARMCFAYLEDIYDTALKSSLLLNKEYILKLYAPTFERIKIMHGTWFENNRSTSSTKGFFEFIHFNKWRDYLDSSEAQILRWNYLSYGYDEKILNPLQVKKNNPLLEYISGIKEKELIVADVGCGNGSFIAKHLAPDYRFNKIYGIDFSDQMIENAIKKCEKFNDVKFCQINLKDLKPLRKELKQNKLDMIFSINSLIACDSNDIDMMLCQIALTLKSGGKFIAVLPSFDAVEHLRTLVFNEFLKDREEYFQICFKNMSFKEKKLKEFYEFGLLSYYFIKLFWRMEYGTWKIRSMDRKEFGALLDTWKFFYQDRKMNDNKKLYADDGVNIQRFIHEDEIDHMFKKVGLKIDKKKKLNYPWNLTKKKNYGYFPGEDEIWDWFVVAKKI